MQYEWKSNYLTFFITSISSSVHGGQWKKTALDAMWALLYAKTSWKLWIHGPAICQVLFGNTTFEWLLQIRKIVLRTWIEEIGKVIDWKESSVWRRVDIHAFKNTSGQRFPIPDNLIKVPLLSMIHAPIWINKGMAPPNLAMFQIAAAAWMSNISLGIHTLRPFSTADYTPQCTQRLEGEHLAISTLWVVLLTDKHTHTHTHKLRKNW